MVPTQITLSDISKWNSLEAIAHSFAKRGLEIEEDSPPTGTSLRFDDGTQFLIASIDDIQEIGIAEILEQNSGEYPNILITSSSYNRFDIFSESDSTPAYGQPSFDHFGFEMQEVVKKGTTSRTVIERLNRIEGYDSDSLNRIYSDLNTIEEFTKAYQLF